MTRCWEGALLKGSQTGIPWWWRRAVTQLDMCRHGLLSRTRVSERASEWVSECVRERGLVGKLGWVCILCSRCMRYAEMVVAAWQHGRSIAESIESSLPPLLHTHTLILCLSLMHVCSLSSSLAHCHRRPQTDVKQPSTCMRCSAYCHAT